MLLLLTVCRILSPVCVCVCECLSAYNVLFAKVHKHAPTNKYILRFNCAADPTEGIVIIITRVMITFNCLLFPFLSRAATFRVDY